MGYLKIVSMVESLHFIILWKLEPKSEPELMRKKNRSCSRSKTDRLRNTIYLFMWKYLYIFYMGADINWYNSLVALLASRPTTGLGSRQRGRSVASTTWHRYDSTVHRLYENLEEKKNKGCSRYCSPPLPRVFWRILLANLSRLLVAFMLAPN